MLPLVWLVSVPLSIGAGVIKERVFSGFLWGLLFGPVGLIIVILLVPDLKKKRLKEAAAKDAELALLRYQADRARAGSQIIW